MKQDSGTKIGRIPILGLKPEVDGGLFRAKAFEGEVIPFGAVVFREGHDSVGAELLLTSPGVSRAATDSMTIKMEATFSGSL